MKFSLRVLSVSLFIISFSVQLFPQNHSVARLWSEELLQAIRNDFARPTVHARNLYHVSIAMYDAWAIYNEEADPYYIGNTEHDLTCFLGPVPEATDIKAA